MQPAVKCRGPEYLRIIYGPEYLLPENLERLRARSVGAKHSLASREFALGIESLERFNRRKPLRRTHECVFGVLALESEPVDPRLKLGEPDMIAPLTRLAGQMSGSRWLSAPASQQTQFVVSQLTHCV